MCVGVRALLTGTQRSTKTRVALQLAILSYNLEQNMVVVGRFSSVSCMSCKHEGLLIGLLPVPAVKLLHSHLGEEIIEE